MSEQKSNISLENHHPKITKTRPRSINIMAAFGNEPPALDFIWPGFLSGTVGVLVAPGATGKSYWALQAAMAVSCGIPGGDLIALSPTRTGAVAYLAGEDPEPALLHRLYNIGQHLDPSAQANIAENLTVESLMGECLDVMDEQQMKRMIDDYSGYRLIILDTLSRIHRLDENSNGDMAQVITSLERLAVKTGASVLYLHHVNKNSAREGQADQQQASRGASALVDNPRWCGYVARMSEKEASQLSERRFERSPIGEDRKNFMRFGVSKQNYGEDLADRWYKRECGGVLVPAKLTTTNAEDTSSAGRMRLEFLGGQDEQW
jgi:RecA-family ATPase